jgi:hypothetical protein
VALAVTVLDCVTEGELEAVPETVELGVPLSVADSDVVLEG